MIDSNLLRILCCPETHQPLKLAEPALVERLNHQIASGQLRARNGETVKESIEGGLVRADGKFVYLIRNSIPIMLIDEAVPLS